MASIPSRSAAASSRPLKCELLRLGQPGGAALAPLLGIATLVLVLKIPGLLGSGFLHGPTAGGSARGSLSLAVLARRALGGRSAPVAL